MNADLPDDVSEVTSPDFAVVKEGVRLMAVPKERTRHVPVKVALLVSYYRNQKRSSS